MVLARPALTEAALIQLARRGDCESFGELYALHVRRVRRHIAYIVKDPEETDDLTSQTFLQAWEALPRYESRGVPFYAWLLRIAHNLAIARISRRHATESLSEGMEADTRSSPEEVTEARSEEERLRRAILRLPEVYRHVVVWRFLWGMEYEHVARLVDRSVGAVRVIQHRALAELRRMLVEHEGAAS